MAHVQCSRDLHPPYKSPNVSLNSIYMLTQIFKIADSIACFQYVQVTIHTMSASALATEILHPIAVKRF